MRNVFRVIVLFMLVNSPVLAQQRSAKRGVCWDEKTQALTAAPIKKMTPGIAWLYNWGEAPTGTPANLGTEMAFLPMCWNASFDETRLRNYLTAHKGEVKYLLAFNEPNLSTNVGGSAMTPQQAANAWSKVKKIAADFDLEIVAPALNFTGDKVGDRVWEPFAWYDEFFRLVPDAGIDYLAFHSYMNWYSAVDWVASRYFYSDTDTKDESDLMGATNRAKYPHLVKYMEDYQTAHGHYPRMFLTEFCSYQGNEYPYTAAITLDFQIDQMTQKVQKLEQSDMVAGYAWFMGNVAQGATAWPYMSVFQTNSAASELSALGQVYVHMSSFDKEKYYTPGETILAKDYIDASMDNQQAKVRPNTETGSDIPLQVEWQPGSWTAYQVDLPSDGEYTLTLHMKSSQDTGFRIYHGALGAANKRLDTTLKSTNGEWQDAVTSVTLTAGQHTLLLYNMSESSVLLNQLRFDTTSGISSAAADRWQSGNDAVYDLQGRQVATGSSVSLLRPGVYIRHGRKFIVR